MNGWRAVFDGVTIRVDDRGRMWLVGGDPADRAALQAFLRRCMTEGWPEVPGWDLPTTPGFDPDLMFLRLQSIGATDVEGPNTLVVELPDDPDVIVG